MTEVFCGTCRRRSLVRSDSRKACFNCGIPPSSRAGAPSLLFSQRLPHVACPDCGILHAGRNIGAPLCASCKNHRGPTQRFSPSLDDPSSSEESFRVYISDESDFIYESSDDDSAIGSFRLPMNIYTLSQRFAEISLDRLAVSKRGSAGVELTGSECPICLKEFVVEELFVELGCAHVYHEDCIEKWLRDHDTCPLCRSRVAD